MERNPFQSPPAESPRQDTPWQRLVVSMLMAVCALGTAWDAVPLLLRTIQVVDQSDRFYLLLRFGAMLLYLTSIGAFFFAARAGSLGKRGSVIAFSVLAAFLFGAGKFVVNSYCL